MSSAVFPFFSEFLTFGTFIYSIARRSQATDSLVVLCGCMRPRFKTVQCNLYWTFFQKPSNIAFREGNVDYIVRPRGVNPPLWLADCCKGDDIYIVIILDWFYNAIYVVFRSIYLPMHLINTYVIDDVCMYNTILDYIFSWNMCILYDGLIRHLNSERYYISATLLEWHGVSNRRKMVVCKTAYSAVQQRNQTTAKALV